VRIKFDIYFIITPGFSGIRSIQYLVFCVVYSTSLFVILFFFIWPFDCLSVFCLPGAIWNRWWQPDIWLVKTFSPSSSEHLQVEPSDVPDLFICSLCHMNNCPKYGTYFLYAHSFPFSNNTSLAPPPQRNIYGTLGDWVCGGTSTS
jgi:hypothetical protein